MSVKTTLPISEARRKIFDIAEEVQKPGTQYTLTEKGKPKAVIMSADEFESWQETLEVMQEMPELAKDIKEADKAVKTGEYKKWTTLEELLAKQGFVLAEKPSKRYGVHSKARAKNRKRAK